MGILNALVVLDEHSEVGRSIDAVFLLAPVELGGPLFFGVGEPFALHAKAAASIGVLKGRRRDG
jgi:hypothetical protein